MIDRAWLETLEFDGIGGMRVHGLEGLGGESVVFRATLPDGRKVVQKVRKHHLGFHIRELPLFLTDGRPRYSVDRLNQKLVRLVGNPLLDAMTRDYDRLYSSIINLLQRLGVPGLFLASTMDGLRSGPSLRGIDSEEAVRFILGTPGIKRRLGDWAALPEQYQDAVEGILTVNGPSFPFTRPRRQLIDWAKNTLAQVEALPAILKPSSLVENPLFVWGAAVTDGFYTDDELPEAAAFLNQHFGPMRKHPQAVIFLQQAKAVAHLLGNYLKDSEVARFTRFCRMLGFAFELQVRNRSNSEEAEDSPIPKEPSEEEDLDANDIGLELSDPPSREEVSELLGRALAEMHLSASHGDLHPDNFGFDPVERKLVFYDLGRSDVLNRPLTLEERAKDLLPLRLHITSGEWQAVCAGYRARAPAEAAEVIALVEERAVALEP